MTDTYTATSLTPDDPHARLLSVFDFDGTLTRHDSFVPFLRYAFGTPVFLRKMILMVLPALRCFRGKLTRDELKEVLIGTFLSGVDEKWLAAKAESYCTANFKTLMRPAGLVAVAAEVHSGAEVTLCSASPALVLQPFAERLGVKLIGTVLEVKDGTLTGRINGHNCRCDQKIRRLVEVYGPLEQFHLRAWGDTRGDYELLAAAKDYHWRHFHCAWARRRSPIERLRMPPAPPTIKK